MSKIAKGIATVAGIAAGGLALLATAGLAAPVIGGVALSASTFSAVAGVANVLAGVTAKRPINVPSVEDYIVGPSTPYPYVMGYMRVYGNMIHSEAHGIEREDIPNPWLTQTFVLSGAGPVQGIVGSYVNDVPVTFSLDAESGQQRANGYYDKYLTYDSRLGLVPESGPVDANAPNKVLWTSSHKTSGLAVVQYSMLLDSKETQWSSGPGKFSNLVRGVLCYDPRLDSTVSGGSGSHRIGVESTYSYSTNPILHGLTYAYGRYQNGVQVFGGGLSITGIDVASFIAAANVNDANGWTIGGQIFENGEDGEIWNNLKRILEAGGAKPTNDGGVLRCIVQTPRVSLDTVSEADLQGPISIPAMRGSSVGFSTGIPVYRSEAKIGNMFRARR